MSSAYSLFEVYGIEMEYMLVDRETLDVVPKADVVLADLNDGQITTDVTQGKITWSNELALHVLELKTTLPAKRLRPLPSAFEQAVESLEPLLEARGWRLLPTAAHPWMDPQQAELWPHEYHEIYATYDRIFDCRTHGWANVQSVHLNLPFANDDEFGRLHAAVRVILPLLPALAASSPILQGHYTGFLDTRMQLVAEHCHAVPFLTGDLIPEPLFSEADYRREILSRLATEIAPLDPLGVMQSEFLNARGAIARFDRGSIELRVMDVQEYPSADVSLCAAVASMLRGLVNEKWSSLESQKEISTAQLRKLLDATSRSGEATVLDDSQWLKLWGRSSEPIRAGTLCQGLLESLRREDQTLANLFAPVEIILEQGTLASRIVSALGNSFSPTALRDVYHDLANCLTRWQPFQP